MKERIVISRPCYDTYQFENVVTVDKMSNYSLSKGYICFNHYAKGSNIARQREQGVAVARQAKVDRILWVDSDVLVFPDSLVKLMEADKDIVSGVIVGKQEPYEILVANKDEKGRYVPVTSLPSKRVIEADAVGFGFILIKTSVFDKIEPPYFVMGDVIGEDYYFCEKAKAAGIDVWVDTGCNLGHVGQYVYTIDDNAACKPEPLIVSPDGRGLVN